MTNSMTAFANRSGSIEGVKWDWDIRSVNSRGLDLRLRLPDNIAGLEQPVRTALNDAFSRGNISANLRLSKTETGASFELDLAQLDQALMSIGIIEARAEAQGLPLATPSATDVLNVRGVMVAAAENDVSETLKPALLDDLKTLIADLSAMRATEGAALQSIIEDQLAQIETLIARAAEAAEARRAETKAAFQAGLARIIDEAVDVSDERVAQELAVLAMKQDVTEELDRLKAHVAAARALLEKDVPVGRKLDFLAQEFNREANTLCSKSQSTDLTAIGLELKAVIEQMREQIQNVE